MGVFNKAIPRYTYDAVNKMQVQPAPDYYVDDIFDPLFNASVKDALYKKYGNRALGTLMGYYEGIENAVFGQEDKYGILGPSMGFLSGFGRSADKAGDILLGSAIEGINYVTGQQTQNPFEKIFVNDEDYSGKTALASITNSMSRFAGGAKVTEDDFGGIWNIPATAIDIASDPGIVGGFAQKASKASQLAKGINGTNTAVGNAGRFLSKYDDITTQLAADFTVPSMRPALRKLRNKVASMIPENKAKDYADFENAWTEAMENPTPENIEKAESLRQAIISKETAQDSATLGLADEIDRIETDANAATAPVYDISNLKQQLYNEALPALSDAKAKEQYALAAQQFLQKASKSTGFDYVAYFKKHQGERLPVTHWNRLIKYAKEHSILDTIKNLNDDTRLDDLKKQINARNIFVNKIINNFTERPESRLALEKSGLAKLKGYDPEEVYNILIKILEDDASYKNIDTYEGLNNAARKYVIDWADNVSKKWDSEYRNAVALAEARGESLKVQPKQWNANYATNDFANLDLESLKLGQVSENVATNNQFYREFLKDHSAKEKLAPKNARITLSDTKFSAIAMPSKILEQGNYYSIKRLRKSFEQAIASGTIPSFTDYYSFRQNVLNNTEFNDMLSQMIPNVAARTQFKKSLTNCLFPHKLVSKNKVSSVGTVLDQFDEFETLVNIVRYYGVPEVELQDLSGVVSQLDPDTVAEYIQHPQKLYASQNYFADLYKKGVKSKLSTDEQDILFSIIRHDPQGANRLISVLDDMQIDPFTKLTTRTNLKLSSEKVTLGSLIDELYTRFFNYKDGTLSNVFKVTLDKKDFTKIVKSTVSDYMDTLATYRTSLAMSGSKTPRFESSFRKAIQDITDNYVDPMGFRATGDMSLGKNLTTVSDDFLKNSKQFSSEAEEMQDYSQNLAARTKANYSKDSKDIDPIDPLHSPYMPNRMHDRNYESVLDDAKYAIRQILTNTDAYDSFEGVLELASTGKLGNYDEIIDYGKLADAIEKDPVNGMRKYLGSVFVKNKAGNYILPKLGDIFEIKITDELPILTTKNQSFVENRLEWMKTHKNSNTKLVDVQRNIIRNPYLNRRDARGTMFTKVPYDPEQILYKIVSSDNGTIAKDAFEIPDTTAAQVEVDRLKNLINKDTALDPSRKQLLQDASKQQPVPEETPKVTLSDIVEPKPTPTPNPTPFEEAVKEVNDTRWSWFKKIQDAVAITFKGKSKGATLRTAAATKLFDDISTAKIPDADVRRFLINSATTTGDTLLGKDFTTVLRRTGKLSASYLTEAEANAVYEVLARNAKIYNDILGIEGVITTPPKKLSNGNYAIQLKYNVKERKLVNAIRKKHTLLDKAPFEDVVFSPPKHLSDKELEFMGTGTAKNIQTYLDRINNLAREQYKTLGFNFDETGYTSKRVRNFNGDMANFITTELEDGGVHKDAFEELHDMLSSLDEYRSTDRGVLGTRIADRSYRGDYWNFDIDKSPLFSENLSDIAKGSLADGIFENTKFQTFTELFVNENFKIKHLFGDGTPEENIATFKKFMEANTGNVWKSGGNMYNIDLCTPVIDSNGKLVGIHKFNQLSDADIEKAFADKDTILLPSNCVDGLDKILRKDARMSNKFFRFINKNFTLPFKFGVLLNPAFHLGNIGDASVKQITTYAQKYGTTVAEETKHLAESQKMYLDLGNTYNSTMDKIYKFLDDNKVELEPYEKIPEVVTSNPIAQKRFRDIVYSNTLEVKLKDGKTVPLNLGLSMEDRGSVALWWKLNESVYGQSSLKEFDDLKELAKPSHFDKSTNPVNRILQGSGQYSSKDPTTWGIITSNPIANASMNASEAIERTFRGTAVLNDLRHKYYTTHQLFNTLLSSSAKGGEFTDEIEAATLALDVDMANAVNAMYEANFNYEKSSDFIGKVGKVVPFPVFFLKNFSYWMNLFLENPKYFDHAITMQRGLWGDKTPEDNFEAEAMGRGAVPLEVGSGQKLSKFFKGIYKPAPMQSMFSAFHLLNNPLEDMQGRLHPLASAGMQGVAKVTGADDLTTYLGDAKYRPYNTNPFQKNIKSTDEGFDPLKYAVHRHNPYERVINTGLRTPAKVRNGDAQLSDFLPSVFQPRFSKKK